MVRSRSVRDRIYRSPAAKTAISIVSSVLIGIFSNTLVTQVAVRGEIVWKNIPTTFSFWALLASCAGAFLFHKNLLAYETEISAFSDDDFCLAYARSQLLPAQVAASMEAIATGNTGQFKTAMKQIKEALK